jgi:acetyltransferase-like isoleucine patch superfamily enzyme
MLRGRAYNEDDPTLSSERRRCEIACERYNSSLRQGSTTESAASHLWAILDPRRESLPRSSVAAPSDNVGSLASGVKVGSDFKCTYGYNLTLQEQVSIGRLVYIDDAASVEIGARSVIGPQVSIVTSRVVEDPSECRGSASLMIASPVVIEAEVRIAYRACISPGVRLGRGCRIGAGAVIEASVPPNAVVEPGSTISASRDRGLPR